MSFKLCAIVIVLAVTGNGDCKSKRTAPPHCTHLTKDTDYASKYRYDYPMMYIPQGQHEAYQNLFCLNPPTVNKAVTTICDWMAPPLVQFTLGDQYVHIVRQDPTGQFLGAAVITTMQICSHNISTQLTQIRPELAKMSPVITEHR